MIKKLQVAYHQRRALNSFGSSDFPAASYHFGKIYELAPQTRAIRHNLALSLMAQGDFLTAEGLLIAELEDFGSYYPRLRALADLYYTWGKPQEAATYYSQCLQSKENERDEFQAQRYLALRQQICTDSRAWEKSRQSLQAYDEGIKAEARAKDSYLEALGLYTQAVELDPTNLGALNNWGALVMNRENNYALALELFDRALALDKPGWILVNRQRALAGVSAEGGQS